MRYLAVLLLLAGCASTDHLCVQEGQFAGDRVKGPDGRMATIKSFEGSGWPDCPFTTHPKRALVEWEK